MRLSVYSCAACRLCASTCGRRYHQHALLGHRNDRVRLPVVLCVLLLFRRCVAVPGTAMTLAPARVRRLSCNRAVTHLSDPGIVPRDWMIKDLPETEYSKKLLLPEGKSASCLQLVPSRARSSPCVEPQVVRAITCAGLATSFALVFRITARCVITAWSALTTTAPGWGCALGTETASTSSCCLPRGMWLAIRVWCQLAATDSPLVVQLQHRAVRAVADRRSLPSVLGLCKTRGGVVVLCVRADLR